MKILGLRHYGLPLVSGHPLSKMYLCPFFALLGWLSRYEGSSERGCLWVGFPPSEGSSELGLRSCVVLCQDVRVACITRPRQTFMRRFGSVWGIPGCADIKCAGKEAPPVCIGTWETIIHDLM